MREQELVEERARRNRKRKFVSATDNEAKQEKSRRLGGEEIRRFLGCGTLKEKDDDPLPQVGALQTWRNQRSRVLQAESEVALRTAQERRRKKWNATLVRRIRGGVKGDKLPIGLAGG